MNLDQHFKAMSTILPTTAVSERRYMRVRLGVLTMTSVLWWLMVLWSSKDVVRSRFFRVRSRADTILQRNSSTGNNSVQTQRPSLLDQENDSKSSLMTDVPEAALVDLSSHPTQPREFKCLGCRATGDCSPNGPRKPDDDLNCSSLIPKETSGYCEVEGMNSRGTFRVMKRTCAKTKGGAIFRCQDAPGFANFRAEAQRIVDQAQLPKLTLPNVGNSAYRASRGIVMVVYPKLVASAYATIRVLRDTLRSQLPIEVWFSSDEMRESAGSLKPLQQLAQNTSAPEITFRDITTNGRWLRFNTKIYAIYNSAFEQVLFLDADNAPVKDPSYLFETPEFVKMGAIFWPDYSHPKHTMFYIDSDSLVWQLLDMPFVDMFEQESGQLAIDRRRHTAPLALVSFYAFHQPNYFALQRLAWGDKDLFHFAWLKLERPFFMIQSPPGIAGKSNRRLVLWDDHGATRYQRTRLVPTPEPAQVNGITPPKIKQATQNKSSTGEFESPPADGYPDSEIWTHLLTFRNTSASSDYIVLGQQGTNRFPEWQRCYGPVISTRTLMSRSLRILASAALNCCYASLHSRQSRFNGTTAKRE